MAKRNKRRRSKSAKNQDDLLLDVGGTIQETQSYVHDHEKTIMAVVGGILIIAAGFFAYKYLIQKPRQHEAVEQMWKAQVQFKKDSFDLALTNPGGGYPGFLDIIDSYGGTASANLAKYYAGISYLNLGKFDVAESYLSEFKTSDPELGAMKYSAIGDAKAEQDDLAGAVKSYHKAAGQTKDATILPYILMKLGVAQERSGDTAAALKSYERIRKDYTNSPEATNIDMYIARVGG